MRKVEAQYHELRTHAGLVAKEKESLAKRFRETDSQHRQLVRDDDENRRKLEAEALKVEVGK